MARRKPGSNDSTAPLDADRLYAVGDAARLLGLSPSGFRHLERSGRLTRERTAGNQRRVSGAELLRFLGARPEDPAPARDRPSTPRPARWPSRQPRPPPSPRPSSGPGP